MRNRQRCPSQAAIGRALAIALTSMLFMAPLFFMLAGSLRAPGLPPPDGIDLFPARPRWGNYRDVFQFVPLAGTLANSLVVALLAVPITVLIASLAGFALATAPRRARKWLIGVSLLALMVSAVTLWVPRFILFRHLKFTDSFVALTAPALMATTPFYVLLFAVAYHRLPMQFYESAVLEGLSPLAIWRKVALPLGKPATFAVSALAFATYWSSFVEPLLYLFSPEKATASLVLARLQTLEPSYHPIMLAASVIVMAPPIIAFLFTQRAFLTKTLEL